ncbi:hypothetical protein SAMN05216344_11285 [Polaromonas sp. OV174]|uniref:hypothetical protein n=1 Tax=Polaromonas sp. OV174 TaxID=1855300 RepID=UPI0008E5489D|nr:hypothetical protein [Polaromonas sp. OV174]SFC25533.1 hypothetical protein SAMN05216344_11285 [Polaromonas sp. OV174]
MLVQLSPQGLALINCAVEVHVEKERELLRAFAPAALAELDSHFSTWLKALDGGAGEITEDANG